LANGGQRRLEEVAVALAVRKESFGVATNSADELYKSTACLTPDYRGASGSQ